MHGHLIVLAQNIIDNPNQRISEIPMLTVEEQNQMANWNNTASTISYTNILELFNNQVKLNPNNLAVSFQRENLTYLELDQKSNSIAHFLLGLNLNRSQPVGIFLESSLEMILAIFGILKAGHTYLPLDADYPKERIDFILENSNCQLIVTNDRLEDKLESNPTQTLSIEEISLIVSNEEIVLDEEIRNWDLAYLIYTSGSTGNPKGVAVTHENLLSSTLARFDYYPNNPRSFLLLTSFSFDSSVAGIFWTLASGGKLVLTKRRIEQELEKLGDIFESESISDTLLLPSLYSTLLESMSIKKLESLERVIVAGEACQNSLCTKHFSKLPETSFYNEYGPTEATVWVTAHKITPNNLESSVPIGRPIQNAHVFILDQNKNQVPIGVWGELYAGGKGISNGYYNNPELTDQVFIQNPFDPSDTLYKTGDMCRFRQNGTIEFKGRVDNQVKIRGYRIELDEIQEKIRNTTTVKDVVVNVETNQKWLGEANMDEKILKHLNKMDSDEINKLLSLVENLSDQEIEFMMASDD